MALGYFSYLISYYFFHHLLLSSYLGSLQVPKIGQAYSHTTAFHLLLLLPWMFFPQVFMTYILHFIHNSAQNSPLQRGFPCPLILTIQKSTLSLSISFTCFNFIHSTYYHLFILRPLFQFAFSIWTFASLGQWQLAPWPCMQSLVHRRCSLNWLLVQRERNAVVECVPQKGTY